MEGERGLGEASPPRPMSARRRGTGGQWRGAQRTKGASQAPAPFPLSTISHDATAGVGGKKKKEKEGARLPQRSGRHFVKRPRAAGRGGGGGGGGGRGRVSRRAARRRRGGEDAVGESGGDGERRQPAGRPGAGGGRGGCLVFFPFSFLSSVGPRPASPAGEDVGRREQQ